MSNEDDFFFAGCSSWRFLINYFDRALRNGLGRVERKALMKYKGNVWFRGIYNFSEFCCG